MDWTPVPHLTVTGSWHLFGLVLDVGMYVLALGVLAGIYNAARFFGREFRKGYGETRR